MRFAAATAVPGFTLTWRASNGLPRTNIAHKIRAFLFANATAAFCQPDFSRSSCVYLEIGSSRRCSVITAGWR